MPKELSKPSRLTKIKTSFEGLYLTIALLKFGMWVAEGGGRSQHKYDTNSRREHGVKYA